MRFNERDFILHVKRGSVYKILGSCKFVSTHPVQDYDHVFFNSDEDGIKVGTSLPYDADSATIATVQCATRIESGAVVVAYQSMDEEKRIWVRPVEELEDGRFTLVMQDPWTAPSPKSPCVGICRMDSTTGRCIGCSRTLQEIADYGNSIKPKLAVESVTIPKSEYESLKADADLLDALRARGVDNWHGYDEAIEMIEEGK